HPTPTHLCQIPPLQHPQLYNSDLWEANVRQYPRYAPLDLDLYVYSPTPSLSWYTVVNLSFYALREKYLIYLSILNSKIYVSSSGPTLKESDLRSNTGSEYRVGGCQRRVISFLFTLLTQARDVA